MFLKERIKRFMGYSPKERTDLIITILAVSFVFAYDDGSKSFRLYYWLGNLLKVILFVTIAFVFRTLLQQAFALNQGYRAEYKAWPFGLILGAVASLLSAGKLYIILPGGIFLHHLAIHRLGKFRYGINTMAEAGIAITGAIANLVLATFALLMSRQLEIMPAFFNQMASINLWIMFFCLLPLPNLDGLYIFFASRLTYVFIFSTLMAYAVLSSIGVYSWIFSLLVGIIAWALFYWYVEANN